MKQNIHTIDASGKPLGRLAVEIAKLLRGKHKPTFMPNKDEGDFVVIRNIKKIRVTGKKMKQKVYYHYSGYPGGLKKTPMRKVFEKNPGEVLRRAVWGMLPKNKLRDRQIKRLKTET